MKNKISDLIKVITGKKLSLSKMELAKNSEKKIH